MIRAVFLSGGVALSGSILLVISARLWTIFALGIAPSEDHLLNHFQHLSLHDLNNNLLQSIFHLHSQPPIWNTLIGLHSKLCDAEIDCVIRTLHYQNIVITIGILICLYRALSALTNSPLLASCSATVFCLTPSVLYFENYIFYPHITLLFSAVFALGAILWFVEKKVAGIVWCGLSLTLLGLTWTLFHPLLVLVLMGVLAHSAWGGPARRTAVATVLSSVLLVMLPSVKNAAVYGFFGNGSWMGINLAQTAPAEIKECGFSTFIAEFQPNTHLGTLLNDPAIIPFSKKCLELAVVAIVDDPIGYVKGRLWSGASSLSKWPSDYLHPPLNWDKFWGHAVARPIVTPTGEVQIQNLVYRIGIFAVNLSALALLFVLSVAGGDASRRTLFAYLFGYALIFLMASHLFNGVEQHRMRYTIQHLFWLPVTLVIAVVAQRSRSWRLRLFSHRVPASG